MNGVKVKASIGTRTIKTCWGCRRLAQGLSKSLSPEAMLAMSQALEECPVKTPPASAPEDTMQSTGPRDAGDDQKGSLPNRRSVRFDEAYERLNTLRLAGDITQPQTDMCANGASKRSIGGGKLANAMELIETVYSGQDGCETDINEYAELDKARLISYEKCMVWLDVQQDCVEMNSSSVQKGVC